MEFSYWKDEILYLESVSPVIIRNAELCTIDLWKMPSKDRRRLLNYHEKTIFDQKECDILKKIVPEKIKKDLVIHRLPLNDELYQDWAGIPGGRVQLRFLLSPIFGMMVTGVGGLMIWSFGHPVLDCSQSFAISGSIGSGITIVG